MAEQKIYENCTKCNVDLHPLYELGPLCTDCLEREEHDSMLGVQQMFVTKVRYKKDIGNLIDVIEILDNRLGELEGKHEKLDDRHKYQVGLLHKRINNRKKEAERNYGLIGAFVSGLVAKVLDETDSVEEKENRIPPTPTTKQPAQHKKEGTGNDFHSDSKYGDRTSIHFVFGI